MAGHLLHTTNLMPQLYSSFTTHLKKSQAHTHTHVETVFRPRENPPVSPTKENSTFTHTHTHDIDLPEICVNDNGAARIQLPYDDATSFVCVCVLSAVFRAMTQTQWAADVARREGGAAQQIAPLVIIIIATIAMTVDG